MASTKLTDRAINALKPASPEQRQYEVWDRVLPGFGVRVSLSGSRSFVVLTRIDGKSRRFTLGRYPQMTLAEAREAARGVLEDAARGIDPKERQRAEKRERERERRNTFRAVAAEFMEHRAAARTRAEMQRKLDRDILPELGDEPIRGITRADIRALVKAKAKSAPIAANRTLSLISAIFNYAVDEEIVEVNPAARMKKPGNEVERERVLSGTEICLVWHAAGRIGYPFGPLYQMLILTGQRRGEVASMRWADIRGNEWLIPSERVKGGRGHAVPLSPLALFILESVPRIGEYVFSSGRTPKKPAPDSGKRHQRGDKPLQGWGRAKERIDAAILADLRKAAEERGDDPDGVKPLPEWHVHDLRRTVATGLRTLGVDRLTVSKILNHREAGITKVYDRYSADPEKRRALEAWSRHVEALIRPGSGGAEVVALRA